MGSSNESVHAHSHFLQGSAIQAAYGCSYRLLETENNQSITSKEDYINCTVIFVDGGEVTTYPNTQIRGRGNYGFWR